ncbi:ubiquinone biosynthesis O-methyltransferase [Advenella faeciporci]|uniref:Ubiquinone biosynthesis O-methyltransferase n=1 Tax=Advenella faeciporci TaxID=797535 RepID=A0A918JDW8_9BURK|nr:bifunctional 2-polyprenyl-6-hydroxyphenol methylase/3-demethylubiquinol 3-O-methyltransferase UbiG [Advenella faeciporci]GGW76142.1 ubiquinone biosynthesis O-methyltransferase [Advenella faeciporci]
MNTPAITSDPINADPAELEKFSALASKWWDPTSEFKPLHAINPLRLEWIQSLAGTLTDKSIIDVGCGGGILSESMAAAGAKVTGIDLAQKSLTVAKLHGLESGIKVEYLNIAVEQIAQERTAQYDVVTCMEMLEHVPDPASIINACAKLVKPGGWVFFSTLNRNMKSFMYAIIGAEYIMNLLPKGTHNYGNFIKPSELVSCARRAKLDLIGMKGLEYNPLTEKYKLSSDTSVNYLIATRKCEE